MGAYYSFYMNLESIPQHEEGQEKPIETKMERIELAALRYGGKMYTGNAHMVALAELCGEHTDVDMREIEEGFVTNTGRFVDRNEAAAIGKKSGQVSSLVEDGPLDSESIH